MDVTPLVKAGSQIIQSYAGGVFKISGVTHEEAVVVTASVTLPWSPPKNLSDLTIQHFESLPEGIDVILLGTGAQMQFLPPAVKMALKEAGLPAIDVMDTGAACRTYNVLLAEGRRVAACLMPV
ncbi:MAG: Mth938-like domain-containing protein [Alphaproteobacteria bacterium]|nr:Mth938-like domain-containing protein [Alphaproteobacteria bacterium]MCD8520080.1 Mth938-like domain-containing protein [Alphaproteobacteria bacterium]MCD8526548.1 Mth938-like domain-containing protein [Alphaproteobacteria bacterium]MCD8571339.1 Mth938-like domain-containing protein [Alphaproteobacteria bacterium]